MRPTVCLLLVAAMVTIVCNCGPTPGSSTPATAKPAQTSTPVPAMVGRWERVLTCQELVGALDKAGLGPVTPYAWLGQTSRSGQSSYQSGSPIPTLENPCVGAIDREHSHFFDAHGSFGSLDWNGGQVDDGHYRLVNADTVMIWNRDVSPPVAFQFHVQGETMQLTPQLTPDMIHEALSDPKGFSAAAWAISVAYPDHSWMRVPCDSWC